MCRKFKEGDIVWCTDIDMYKITCYRRPCTVTGYDIHGSLLLRAFNQSNLMEHDVNEKLFELVPSNRILKAGQMIGIMGLSRLVEFKKYKNDGYIEVVDNNWHSEYHVNDIIYEEGFYI